MKRSCIAIAFSFFVISASSGQIKKRTVKETGTKKENGVIARIEKKAHKLIGTASFYADKFCGRKTANGETFSQGRLTAACNILPLGTWIRVTNLRNMRSIVVQVNDRLNKKNMRIVDLSYTGAHMLNYVKNGLAHVKLEVLDHAVALR